MRQPDRTPLILFATLLGLIAGGLGTFLLQEPVPAQPGAPVIEPVIVMTPGDSAAIVREAAAVARQGARDEARFAVQTAAAAILTAQAAWQATVEPRLARQVERNLIARLSPVATAEPWCGTPQPGAICKIPPLATPTPPLGTLGNPHNCATVDWTREWQEWCRWPEATPAAAVDERGTPR